MCNYSNCDKSEKGYTIDYFDWGFYTLYYNIDKPQKYNKLSFCSEFCLSCHTNIWMCYKCGLLTGPDKVFYPEFKTVLCRKCSKRHKLK